MLGEEEEEEEQEQEEEKERAEKGRMLPATLL